MKDRRLASKERLIHIGESIANIESFVDGKELGDFRQDPVLSSAVLFQFSVIGEAVNHIDKDLLENYDYPWYKVRSFRNLITHVYFRIKPEAVWETIRNDLPDLKAIIGTILDEEF